MFYFRCNTKDIIVFSVLIAFISYRAISLVIESLEVSPILLNEEHYSAGFRAVLKNIKEFTPRNRDKHLGTRSDSGDYGPSAKVYSVAIKKKLFFWIAFMAIGFLYVLLYLFLGFSFNTVFVTAGAVIFIISSLGFVETNVLDNQLLLNSIMFLMMALLAILLLLWSYRKDKAAEKCNSTLARIVLSILISYSLALFFYESLYFLMNKTLKSYFVGVKQLMKPQIEAIKIHAFQRYDKLKKESKVEKREYDKNYFPVIYFVINFIMSILCIIIGFYIKRKAIALGIINAASFLFAMTYWTFIHYKYFGIGRDPIYYWLGAISLFNLLNAFVVSSLVVVGCILLHYFYGKHADRTQSLID